MGAGASTAPYATREEALAAGKSQEEIDEYLANTTRGLQKSTIGKKISKEETLKKLFTNYEKNSICLIFAVNKYPNAKTLKTLSCAVNDGMLVAETLCGEIPKLDANGMWESNKDVKKGQHFKVKMFADQAVTKQNIEQELVKLMKQYPTKKAQVGRLYICMAGHGLPDDDSGSSIFCCNDYNEEDSYSTS